jgi:hypothetical protein
MLFDRKIAGGALLGVTVAVGSMVGASALRQGDDTPSNLAGSRTLLTGVEAAAVGCQPHEAAVIQEFNFRGERGFNSTCVILSESAAAVPSGEFTPVGSSRLMPAAYQAQPAVITSPAPVAPGLRRTRQQARTVETGRTWKKTALIIGGSTAAGAGIGGLIGGIYEAMKRR